MQTLDITKIYSVKEEQEQYTRSLKEPESVDIFSEIEALIEYDDFQFLYLSQLYKIEEPNPVRSFINEYPYVYKILFEAPDHIKQIFGDVPLNLELYHDPEEDYAGFFIIINTQLPSEESLKLLDQLDEEWWLTIDDDISNILEIMVR